MSPSQQKKPSMKRQRSEYEAVQDDDEIAFVVDKKRARYESGDSDKVGKIGKIIETIVISDDEEEEEEEEVDSRETNRRSPNGFLLPDPLPKGVVLTDTCKKKWKLGKSIGLGGFGEIYLASKLNDFDKSLEEDYIIKVEPHTNGPLFVEIHFYLQAANENLEEYKTANRLKHLGIPSFVASGSYKRKKDNYRFLVMPRFGSDLQRILDHLDGQKFTRKTACSVGLQVIDSLEFIHSKGYVHKDIKASNLLIGRGIAGQHEIFLVDYGLCSKFEVGGLHKPFVHNRRWAHEGTMEYTSREAHIGCAGRRGDLEVLLYNLVEWCGGWLPWDRDHASIEEAEFGKFLAFEEIQPFLNVAFQGNHYPQYLCLFMKYINTMTFEETPDYNYLRSLLKQDILNHGWKVDGKMEFKLVVNPKQENYPDTSEFCRRGDITPLQKRGYYSRFDKMATPEQTWKNSRDDRWSNRSQNSLTNPTNAMMDIIVKSQHRTPEPGSPPKLVYGERNVSRLTPAMEEVMKLKKLKSKSPDPSKMTLIPTFYLGIPVCPNDLVSGARPPTPPESNDDDGEVFFKLPSARKISKAKRRLDMAPSKGKRKSGNRELERLNMALDMAPSKGKRKSASRELERLKPFLEDPSFRRRANSANSVPIDKNPRNKIQEQNGFGFGSVRRLFRRVSESLFKY